LLKRGILSPIIKFKRGRVISMLIDKIKGLGQSLDTKRTSQLKSITSRTENDKIQISEEAKQKATELKLEADIKSIAEKAISLPTDSARTAKLKEIKEKLARGEYDNPTSEMLSGAADQILLNLYRSSEM
jgi:anti-sigma28 factor (negative regulator of flagellin synthesis)